MTYKKEIGGKNRFHNNARLTSIYKDGQLFAVKFSDESIFRFIRREKSEAVITRNMAFRYWEKHFNKKHFDCLPKLLQIAIDINPYEGNKAVTRNGTIIYID